MKQKVYVVLGTVVLLISGLIYAWSILSAPLIQEFDGWSLSQISFAFTICTFMFCLGGFCRGIIASKISVRLTMILSGILNVLGLFLTASVQQNIFVIYFGFGVLCGFAVGLAYNTIMSVVTEWFSSDKGLVSGILLMGFGFGSFVIGKSYQVILSSGLLGWRELFCIMGLLVFIVYVAAGLFIKKPNTSIDLKERRSGGLADMNARQMISNKSFQIYFVWAILLASSGYILLAHANGMLNEAVPKIDAGIAANIVSLISICNGAGRIVWGMIYDKMQYKRTMWIVELDFAVCVLALYFGLQSGSTVLMTIGYIAGGLFFAGLAALNPACISDFFGEKYYPINFSIINMNVLISSFGSTLAAALYDNTGSFNSVVILLGIVWCLSVCCVMFIKRPVASKVVGRVVE